MVCLSWEERNIRANRKWFQLCTKAKEPTAISPGRSIGSTMARKARIREQPSTQAASSSDSGTFLMKPLMRIIDSGSWKTVSAMITLHTELMSWRLRKVSNSGTSISAPGMNCEHSSASMKAFFRRNRKRARAYPPASATTVVITIEAMPT